MVKAREIERLIIEARGVAAATVSLRSACHHGVQKGKYGVNSDCYKCPETNKHDGD